MPAIGITVSVVDAKGATSNSTVWVPGASDIDDVIEFAEALAQNWANMQTGKVTKVGVTIAVDISSLSNNTLGANSDVEEGARFGWGVVGGFKSSNRIATFDETLIVSGTKQVDITDTDVAEFIGWMVSGFTPVSTVVILPTDYRSAVISSQDSALEDFQKSRKLKNQ